MQAQLPLETITPKKAEQFLNANKINRKLRDGVVERYADDMRSGRWTDCIAPIAFYDDGDLADGQHRLWAIIESDKPQKFYVLRGVSRDAGLNIDTGVARSVVDNAKIAGIDTGLTNELLAVGRAFATGERAHGKGGSGTSNAVKLQLLSIGREHCEWACGHGPRGKFLRNNLVLAAIARARANGANEAALMRFSEVLTSGFSDGDREAAAIALRNYLLAKGSVASSSGLWRDTFLKTQNAIKYFVTGKSLTAIKKVSEEAYPIPKKRK